MPQAAEGGLGWETNHKGSGDGSPQRGPGAESPEAEEFLKYIYSYKHILRNFWYTSISHILTYITYICLCFSALAGITPLSLRNGGGAFDTVCPPPLSASEGGVAPSAPGSAAYMKCRHPCGQIFERMKFSTASKIKPMYCCLLFKCY